ncbi:HAD family hydrolase [Ralstonia sp. ASV6]|uniref:HAD family hydrolase n=1 Tax=Ralstonia sp. ASV6 TaxID=2795124 RepID=UPI0018ECCA6B|nr:HAD family hydrolase [Ralstonia sp. ASV6]
MDVRAVVFDAFGTLVRIGDKRSPYRRLMQWMHENGRKPTREDAARIMSHPGGLADAAAMFGITPSSETLATLEEDLHTELGAIQLFPDTASTLLQLRGAGYRIGLCSNLAAPYGPPLRSLLPSMDAYVLSYEVGAIKPDPRIYQHLVNALDCRPADILFIGDTPSADLEGPRAFGMTATLIDRTAGQTLEDVLAIARLCKWLQ